MPSTFKVLLASVGSFFDTSAEVPFIFKKAGCGVDVFCSTNSWLRSNRFHDNWIEVSENETEFVSQLIELVKEKFDEYQWVLLLDDITIKLLNQSISGDERLFKKILPINKIENREILSSKIGLSNVCKKYGIDTPRYVNYSEVSDVATIISSLDFPILLKEDFSFSGLGIQFCKTAGELQGCLDKVRNKTNLVLQEFIEGEDVGVEALFYDGGLITYNCAKILAYMEGKFSFTTRRLYCPNETVKKILENIAGSVGMNCLASIQFIYHPTRNIYYLIEVDSRPNSWMAYSRFTGHDFIKGVESIVEKKEFKPTNMYEANNNKIEITIFDKDFRRCVANKDIKGIIKWVLNDKGCWRFLPVYDMVFFGRILKKQRRDLLAKVFKRS